MLWETPRPYLSCCGAADTTACHGVLTGSDVAYSNSSLGFVHLCGAADNVQHTARLPAAVGALLDDLDRKPARLHSTCPIPSRRGIFQIRPAGASHVQ